MVEYEIRPDDDAWDYEGVEFMLHEYELEWTPATREHAFDEAYHQAVEALPNHLSEEEVERLAKAVFKPLYEVATDDGFSLWVSLEQEDGAFEYPVYNRSPVGAWNSPEPSFGTTGKTLSDAFFEAVAVLFRASDGESETPEDQWGGVSEAVWDRMSEYERETVSSLRNAAIQGTVSPFAGLLVGYARWRVDDN